MLRIDYYNARLLNYLGKPAQAIPYFKKVLPIAQELGDDELVLTSSLFISWSWAAQGYLARMGEILAPILVPLKQRNGHDMETLRAYTFYAVTLAVTGRHKLAKPVVDEVLGWVREINQDTFTNYFHMNNCSRYLLAGDWPGAVAASRPMVERPSDAAESVVASICWDVSAWAHSQMGKHQTAAAHRARAIEIRQSIGGGLLIDWFEAGEAEQHLSAGRTAAALEQAQKTVTTYKPRGLLFGLTVAERVWGCALARLGADMAEADSHFRESLAAAETAGLVAQSLQTELWWGRVYRERKDFAAAQVHFDRARQLMTDEMASYAREESLRIIRGEQSSPAVPVPEHHDDDPVRLSRS
jgi:tetratricopeptide (TPR) repeat protein